MTTDVFTPKVKLEHVISFSDAVFAFAITFMAISIDIPDLPTNLTQSQYPCSTGSFLFIVTISNINIPTMD